MDNLLPFLVFELFVSFDTSNMLESTMQKMNVIL